MMNQDRIEYELARLINFDPYRNITPDLTRSAIQMLAQIIQEQQRTIDELKRRLDEADGDGR